MACCTVGFDAGCNDLPEPCNPPKSSTQWLLNIPRSENAQYDTEITITNFSPVSSKMVGAIGVGKVVLGTLYDPSGQPIFTDKSLVRPVTANSIMPMTGLEAFESVRLKMDDLTAGGDQWKTKGILKISNADTFLIRHFFRSKSNDPIVAVREMEVGRGSAKHRLTNIPPPAIGVVGAELATISIVNIGDTPMKVRARLHDMNGGDHYITLTDSLAPMATLLTSSVQLANTFGITWAGRAWIEIYPEDARQRCNGKMLVQSLVQQRAVPNAPLFNATPVD
jgi:hypothetical protein